MGSIGDIHVITFITHKSHFQDRNRYSAPVGTGHVVSRDHTFVGKSGGRTVAVYDTFGQSITFFDKVCIKILVGAGRCHSKCSGSGCAVVAVCMNADGDICILRGGKFRTFFVADRFIVVFACHDDFISAGRQFLFKNERYLQIYFVFRNFGIVAGGTGRCLVFGLRGAGSHRFLGAHINPAALMSRIDAYGKSGVIGRSTGGSVGCRPVNSGRSGIPGVF